MSGSVSISEFMENPIKNLKEFFELAYWLGLEVNHLWGDAFLLSKDARNIQSDRNEDLKKERFLRASVVASAAAFEASTNFLVDRLIQLGVQTTETEKDLLQDRRWELRDGYVKARSCGHISSKERFLLLFRLVTGGKELGTGERKELDAAFEIRNALAHPKPGCDLSMSKESRADTALFGFFFAQLLLFRAFAERFRDAFEEWRKRELRPKVSEASTLDELTGAVRQRPN